MQIDDTTTAAPHYLPHYSNTTYQPKLPTYTLLSWSYPYNLLYESIGDTCLIGGLDESGLKLGDYWPLNSYPFFKNPWYVLDQQGTGQNVKFNQGLTIFFGWERNRKGRWSDPTRWFVCCMRNECGLEFLGYWNGDEEYADWNFWATEMGMRNEWRLEVVGTENRDEKIG
jgi:hypothetical protein